MLQCPLHRPEHISLTFLNWGASRKVLVIQNAVVPAQPGAERAVSRSEEPEEGQYSGQPFPGRNFGSSHPRHGPTGQLMRCDPPYHYRCNDRDQPAKSRP